MKKKNIIAVVLFLAFAVAVWFISGSFVTKLSARLSANQLGNDFFPKLVAVLMAILSLILLAQTIFSKPGSPVNQDPPEEERPTRKELVLPAIGVALMVMYLIIIEPIGFVLSTAMLILAFLALVRCRKWYYYVVTPLIGSLGVYMLFTRVFLVILPVGILPI